jgi:hypothetical protein
MSISPGGCMNPGGEHRAEKSVYTAPDVKPVQRAVVG